MKKNSSKFYRFFQIMIAGITLLTMLASGLVGSYQPVFAATGLTVEIIAAPNLIVDSNVMSPSTQQPIVATVIGKFCNTTGTDIDNVTGYIGDYNTVTPANSTPGTYPPNTPGTITDGVVSTIYVGTYQFSHLGGTADATRYIGTVSANSCKYQYWSFTYPKYAKNAGGTIPSWGTSVKPGDDLWLEFDIWGNYPGQTATYDTHRMTMRNEISAMANKIEPNGNPGGHWFNTDTSTVLPGQTVVTNGILYRLGNVNQGFDNDGNGVPDYNAWLQPFGNPSYDPSCFRLISTTGTVTVSTTSGEVVIPFKDNLYFTDLPQNNTNVVGEVFYEFLALGGACTIPISPYQEAASGSDNEKFNGDYGAGPEPTGTYAPEVTISKSAPGSVALSATYTYTIPFANTGASTAGLTLTSGGVDAPLTVEDWVPSGLEYVCNSASTTLTAPNTVTTYYSTDSGLSWSETQPASCPGTNPVSTGPNSLFGLRWKLGNPLPKSGDAGSSNTVTFQAKVPSTYISGGNNPFIENCAEAKFGVGSTPFAEGCTTTMVDGTGQIGNRVWVDANANGIQDTAETTQISNIGLSLYWDKNGNGLLDSEDVLVATRDSGSNTDADETNTNYNFTNLPAGKYIVKINKNDPDIDTGATVGYALTGPDTYAVTLAGGGNYNAADFGFGPVLVVDKHISTLNSNVYEGGLVTFHINMYNKLPGDGTSAGFCKYTVYAGTFPPTGGATGVPGTGTVGSNQAWTNESNGLGSPDGQYAYTNLSNNDDQIGFSGFNTQGLGNITSVRLVTNLVVVKQLQASASEGITYNVYRNDNATASHTFTYNGLTHITGAVGTEYVHDNVLTGTWNWTDFAGDLTEFGAVATGTGSPDVRGDVGLDSVAFVITTDKVCSGADTTITELPLTDTYDADLLEFVSASPAQTTSSTSGTAPNTTGTLTWSNLGPLYAGGTKEVAVTFRARDPGADSISTTNTATVASNTAKFGNGRYTNGDDDTANVTILATGKISGTVFSDGNTNNWQGTTGYDNLGTNDFGIPGATVTLYGCYVGGALITDVATNKDCTGQTGTGTWTSVTTTTTDANGYYEFTGLRMGYYYVAVTLPTWAAGATQSAEAGTSETNQNAPGQGHTCGTCGSQWGDTAQNLNPTTLFNPIGTGDPLATPNEDIPNVSFGYTGVPNRIYGQVYTDSNGNGTQESGEANLSGVTVRLCTTADCSGGGNPVATTTTAADGTFSFNGVASNTYYVVVTQPSNTTQTDDPDNSGNCGVGCDNRTNSFTIAAAQTRGSYIFGYQPTGSYSIGDTVYRDWDGDGTQDSGEEGLPNIDVSLYEDEDNDGVIDSGVDALIKTTPTDTNGNYTFGSLPNGNYIVVVNTADAQFPANHTQTGDPDGACPGSSCDSRSVTAAISGASDLDNDFGYQPSGFGKIGDFVWIDSNGDGLFNNAEVGQSNVTVNLYQDADGDGVIDAEDAFFKSTTTLGYAVINGYIDIDGDSTTPPDAGDALASLYGYQVIDGALDIDKSGTITTADDGTFGPYTVIDGRLDFNYDGSVDADDDGSLAGFYLLKDLPAEKYIVQVAPAEFTAAGDLYGYLMSTTGAAYNTTQISHKVTLTDATLEYYAADFGFSRIMVGDFIWADYDGDGLADLNEPGINDVVVELYTDVDNSGTLNVGDTLYGTTTTANNSLGEPGYYLFGGMPAGNYIVKVADSNFTGGGALVGYTLSADPDVYNDTTPSSVSCLTTGAMGCDNLKPFDRYASSNSYDQDPALPLGTIELTADFGYQPVARVGDTLWIDSDGDGVRDPDERGIPNVTVRLCTVADCSSGTVVTTTTDENGEYTFGNMTNGTYYVVVTTSGIPTGLTQTYDPVTGNTCNLGTCTTAPSVTINVARVDGAVSDIGGNACLVGVNCDLNVDFGWRFYGDNTINGTVWFDADQGGQTGGAGDIDAGETTRYGNVPVYLWHCGADGICGGVNSADDTLVGSTLTAANGTYSFGSLANGTYKVIANTGAASLTGLTITTPSSYTGIVLSGTTTATRDYGFYAAMDLGDLPASYNNTLLADNGARHTIPGSGAVYLGTSPSTEGDGKESGAASGDNLDDGVTPMGGTWSVGAAGGSVQIVTSASCTALNPCYLSAWINWNGTSDSDFSDSGERIFLDKAVYGTQTLTFDIPSGTVLPGGTFYARFRLYPATTSDLAQPTGLVSNGEVEDYVWTLGTTAVSLQSLNAYSVLPALWLLAAGALAVLAALALLLRRK